MNTSSRYDILRESHVAEILRHYICTGRQTKERSKRLKWLHLSDKRLLQKFHELDKTQINDEPTLLWAVGPRAERVSRWVLANSIHLADLYSCGIRSEMKGDLDCVKGNLKQFVKTGCFRKYDDFKRPSIPREGKARTVIGVAHFKSDRHGRIELVDGAHRVVALLANDIESCRAYIGEING